MGSMFSWPSDTDYPHGDIRKVNTTGASDETARADGKSSRGVRASHEMAEDDLPYIKKYKDKIIRAAKKNDVQPSVVAGIISRETRGGRGAGLDDGWGNNGNAFGLMQIDKDWHTPRGEWDSQEHINQGTKILVGLYSDDIEEKFPRWDKNQKLKGALAAYNMGTEKMASSYSKVDDHTTGGDYSNDVTARAQYYEKNGF
ncbi:lysozyme g-like isoform X1 [Thunnus albacares]|uniref:lysozyme g-like isoform X1 n=1 Tax=Thunnus albacares TaxID=8236 RepID=UPI001CF616B2|nr:lysozyme g-like isoform X1 [Thunnus albacares]